MLSESMVGLRVFYAVSVYILALTYINASHFHSSFARFRNTYPQNAKFENSLCSVTKLTGIRGGMQVFVKTVSGNTLTVEVEPDESVHSLKNKIEKKEGI